jgi:hypothetical protein
MDLAESKPCHNSRVVWNSGTALNVLPPQPAGVVSITGV